VVIIKPFLRNGCGRTQNVDNIFNDSKKILSLAKRPVKNTIDPIPQSEFYLAMNDKILIR
jgi:hypothetical protein